MLDDLKCGLDAFERRSWADAYTCFASADQTSALGADDLERFATCAYLTGRTLEFHKALERAHHAHLTSGERLRAARAAFWLGLTLLLDGATGPGNGWLSRAARLIDAEDCVERGYLLLPSAEQLLAEANSDAAHQAASHAAAIGVRFADADLTACARHLEGRALMQHAQIKRGLVLLDEAMVAVVAGELSPIMTGLIYCSVIESCQRVFAWSRARQWTSALSQWCEQQPQMVAFTGTCLAHRAEILQFHGAWPNAMTEAHRACERSREDHRKPPGAALYQQGEIHRLQGEFAEAEEAYRHASELGYEPQPGLALLSAASGRIPAAAASIRRAISSTTDPLSRARLLPAYIEIMLIAGDTQSARGAVREMETVAHDLDADVLHAITAYCRGAVEHGEGDAAAALASLRRACDTWLQLEAPYAAARARVLLGLACQSLGDEETARLEFNTARSVFCELRAAPDLARLDAIESHRSEPHREQLTPRELQVLRSIAGGKTNKVIATELSVSERTIDRHVSNILTKLDVPSRTAATAYAFKQKLF